MDDRLTPSEQDNLSMECSVIRSTCLAIAACLTFAGSLAAGEAEDQYAVAAGHYAEARWDLAVEQFTDFVRKYPSHANAYQSGFYLGEAYVQLGRFEDALKRFNELLAANPEGRFTTQIIFRSGEMAYLNGRHEDAKRHLLLFREKFPEDQLNAFVLPYLGEIALAGGDLVRAQANFAEALREYPTGALRQDCQLGLAKSLSRQSRHKESERLLRELVADRKSGLADQAQHELALVYYRTGKNEQALAIWKTFDEQFPESSLRSKVSLGRGWALYRLERFGEAQGLLAALTHDKDVGIEAQYWLGLTQRALKLWRQSAETLMTAAAADQSHALLPAIRFHAGDSLLHTGQRQEAVRQFDLVLEKSADSKWADDSFFGKIQATLEAENHGDVDRLAIEFQQRFPNSALRNDVQLLRAASLMALEKYDTAAKSLAEYLAANPETPQAPVARSEQVLCYVHLKKIGEARVVYEEMMRRHPHHEVVSPTAHHLAEAAYAAGDREWSAKLFKQMASKDNSPETVAKGLSGLAWSQLNAEDLEGSGKIFDRLLKEYPKDPLAAEAALIRGQIFSRQGKEDAALAMYLLIIQEYPQSPEFPSALYRAAKIHDKLQQDQQAATLYGRLVKDHPKFLQIDAAVYGLAWVNEELGRTDEATEQFQRLHDEFPQSKYWADATFRLASRASAENQFDRATGLLNALVKTNPETQILSHALYLQGRIASRRELWEEVKIPMTRLVREIPESPLRLPAEYSLAEAAYRQEKYDEAGEVLERLVKQTQGRQDAWLAMISLRWAQVLSHRKQWKEALKVARGISEQFPRFNRQYEADYLVGRCLAAQGELVTARASYQKVIRSASGSKTETAAMAQWMIGETYMHQKDYVAARREFLRTEILYAYPKWQAASLLQAGKCHELLSEWGEATELYSRLLKKYPDTALSEEATRRLRVAEQRATRTR